MKPYILIAVKMLSEWSIGISYELDILEIFNFQYGDDYLTNFSQLLIMTSINRYFVDRLLAYKCVISDTI